jgi:4-amino-4-deoxy-L-arabinose transferase-like glycosyltransferase
MRKIVILACICLIAFAVRVSFLFSTAFLSDESIYVYAAYAIQSGVKPFSEIALVHPPLMYAAYAGVMQLFDAGADLFLVRLFSITLSTISVIQVYFLGEILSRNLKSYAPRDVGLACAAVSAFYPIIIPFSIASPLVNLFTVFTLGCLIFYSKFLQHKKWVYVLLTGVFAGLACMTWYIAAFFVASLFIFEAFRVFWQREKITVGVKQLGLAAVGAAIPIAAVLSWIHFVWNSLPLFFTQTFMLQTTRAGLTPWEKWLSISSYLISFFPLIVAGAVGIFVLTSFFLKRGPLEGMLPAWLFISNFVFLSVIPRTTFMHYFFFLNPYLIFVSIVGGFGLFRLMPRNLRKIANKRTVFALLATLAALVVLSASVLTGSLISASAYFSTDPNQYTKAELYVGSFVANLTGPADLIWTSETGIAFFAERPIVAPNSTVWPIQGFFNDVFDTEYVDANGVIHQGIGITAPNMFTQSWENDGVKVLVFIRGAGPVPYPDDLLWYGYESQVGVEDWVESHFSLLQIVSSQNVAYTYEVWVRK